MPDASRGLSPVPVLLRLLRNLGIVLRDLVMLPFVLRVPRDWIVVRLDRGLVDAGVEPPLLGALQARPRALGPVLQALARAGADPRASASHRRVARRPSC